jgi:urease accessory protein UreH
MVRALRKESVMAKLEIYYGPGSFAVLTDQSAEKVQAMVDLVRDPDEMVMVHAGSTLVYVPTRAIYLVQVTEE